MKNNPLSFVDPDGKQTGACGLTGKKYIFNPKGRYVRTDLTNPESPSTIVVVTTKESTSPEAMTFSFHDPEKDIPYLEETIRKLENEKMLSETQLIVHKRSSDIQNYLDAVKIPMMEGGPGAWLFAKNESNAGRLDFAFGPLANEPLPHPDNESLGGERSIRDLDEKGPFGDRPGLFLFQGRAYNYMDFGNFLWGAGMSRLGVSEDFSQWAGELNEIHRLGDDTADQLAIEAGHRFQSKHDAQQRLEMKLQNRRIRASFRKTWLYSPATGGLPGLP
jgi:hypothetical protein